MHSPDLSREKSLYHLLLTVVRRLNAPISPHKKQISDALKLLEITKSAGEYLITVDVAMKPRSTSIQVSDVKFYDTKNDPSIAERNLKVANQIALDLFPELNPRGAISKKDQQFNYTDLLFAFYSISLVLFYILDSQIFLGVPAAIAFGFIPFWNLSSNLNPRVRWLSSIVFSILCFILFYSSISGLWIEIHIAIMLSIFFLNYYNRRPLGLICLPIFTILLALMLFNQDYLIAILALTFVIIEKLIELLFRNSKKFGLATFGIIFVTMTALMFRELATFNNPYVSIFLGALTVGYFLFIYGVGVSWAGFLRTILPSLGALSLAGTNALLYFVGSLVVFTCFKMMSNQIDRKSDAT